MKNGKVSVIIATYNRKKYFEHAVISVLNQTYPYLEVIVVDDGSTDGTKEFIKSISDNRIKYIYQKNSGQNAAKNTGLLAALGQYITILDSDDVIHPDKIKKQVAALVNNPEYGFVYCGTLFINNENNIVGKQKLVKHRGWVLDKLLMKNFIYNGSNALYKKECIEKVGIFDETVQRMTDWDLYLRMAVHYKFVGLDDYLLYYRVHDENMSCGFKKYEIAGNTILDRVFANPDLDKKYLKFKDKAYALRQRYMARRYFENGDTTTCKSYLKRAFSACPGIILEKESMKLYFLTFLPVDFTQNLKRLINSIKKINLTNYKPEDK